MSRVAKLLRVGLDTGCGGGLGPIWPDRFFEYIPIPEFSRPMYTGNNRTPPKGLDTYSSMRCRNAERGVFLSAFVPRRISGETVHHDPEFETCTYGDCTGKAKQLAKLQPEDLLVFYAGLRTHRDHQPHQRSNLRFTQTGLYIIGHLTVMEVVDFTKMFLNSIASLAAIQNYPNNAHIRSYRARKDARFLEGLVLVAGDPARSRLLRKAIPISRLSRDKTGKPLHVVSYKMQRLLGIKGSIQRSVPIRTITDPECLYNLEQLILGNILEGGK